VKWIYYRLGDRSRLREELEPLKRKNAILDFRLDVFELDEEDVGYVKAYVRLHPRNGSPMLRRIEQERTMEQMARLAPPKPLPEPCQHKK